MNAHNSHIAYSLALTLLLSSCCTIALASMPKVTEDLQHMSDREFRQLAGVTSGSVRAHHGARRALLQSTGFDTDFFNILEPLLEGNTSTYTYIRHMDHHD